MAVGQYTESLTLKEMKCTIPEYVITFDDDINIIIVVECKNAVKKHCSASMDRPSMFAVDGVLYYAKFLKEGYHVIAIAVSGTTTQNMKVDTFYWMRGAGELYNSGKSEGYYFRTSKLYRINQGKQAAESIFAGWNP